MGQAKRKIAYEVIPEDWKDIIEEFAALPCNNAIRSVLRRIILATVVYMEGKEC